MTFLELRKLVAPYAGNAGRCFSSQETARFAKQVMQHLLYSGSHAGIRKLCILANQGCITLPPEVEIPLKARIDHRVANIWNKWFTFHSVNEDFDSCPLAGEVLQEDGVQTPLAYGLPSGGSVIGVLGVCDESPDSFVIVQGKDVTGREIYTSYKGEQVVGERFSIDSKNIRYGQVTFGEITGVLKSRTNGYVSLHAVDPVKNQIRQFLADWAPSEEKPLYRRFRITSRDCIRPTQLSLLCRVRLKDSYHDNELTLFDNSLAITLAAQRIQNETNNDAQNANYKRQALEDVLDKEAGFKKISGSPVDVYWPLSGGAIKGIV